MHAKKYKIGVWMPNWVGDACMATPALRSLADAFGQKAELVGVMKPVIRDVLSGTPWLHRTVLFNTVLSNTVASDGVHSRTSLVGALRSLRLDLLILLTNSFWTAAVGRLAGIRRLVGYDRDCRSWMLTDRVPVPRDGKKLVPISPVDYFLQLTHSIGCSSEDRRMELSILPEEQRQADRLWRQLDFDPERPTIAINNSGATAPSRLWPSESIESLATRIVANHPWQVLLHCGPGERDQSNAMAQRIANPRVRSMGETVQLPIGLSKAALARARAIVSTDSGPRHLAIALDRSVISLFGSTGPSWTTTYNGRETAIELDLACRPCWAKTCPLKHHHCMTQLGVDRVYQQVVRTLQGATRTTISDQRLIRIA